MYLFYNKRVARILGRFASSQVGIDRSAHARLDSIKVARAARTKVCAYMIYHPWWATVGDKRTFIHLAADPRWDMYTWSNVRAPQRRNTVVNDTRDAPSRAKRVAWPRTVTRDENSACLFLIRATRALHNSRPRWRVCSFCLFAPFPPPPLLKRCRGR